MRIRGHITLGLLWCMGIVGFPRLLAAKSVKDSLDMGYARRWERIDAFMAQKRPLQALPLLDSNYEADKDLGRKEGVLKAQLYYLHVVRDTSEVPDQDMIAAAERFAAESKFPNNAIWQSIAAQMYTDYFNRNREKIMQSGVIPTDVKIDDVAFWDAPRFLNKISALYMRSLSKGDALRGIPVGKYDLVVFGDPESTKLRPTLFDLLAFRALAFFQEADPDLLPPSKGFKMNDPDEFAPAGAFETRKFPTTDLADPKWLSLQWYKQLLLSHENDTDKDSYIDIDLQRLDFVFRNSSLYNKKQLYIQALGFIEAGYPNSAKAADAAFMSVVLSLGFENSDIRSENIERFIHTYESVFHGKFDFEPIVGKLRNIVAKFPETEGGLKAAVLIAKIEHKRLSFETESVVPPDRPFRIPVSYRNVGKIKVRIIPGTFADYRKRISDTDQYCKSLMRKPAVFSKVVDLPISSDYYGHSIEVDLPPMPAGLYCIVCGQADAVGGDSNLAHGHLVQISKLAHVSGRFYRGDGADLVVNRITGEPMQGTNLYRFKPNDTRYAAHTRSAKDGTFRFKAHHAANTRGYFQANWERDTLIGELEPVWAMSREHDDSFKTLWFPEKTMYNLGETIRFSGWASRWNEEHEVWEPVDGESTDLELYDGEGVKIASVPVTSNSDGVFVDSFETDRFCFPGVAEIRSIWGRCKLVLAEAGTAATRVFLYTPKSQYLWNEPVSVKGMLRRTHGKDPTGRPVACAVVRYRYGIRVYAPETVLQKIVNTDKDGRFGIDFRPRADIDDDSACFVYDRYVVKAGYGSAAENTDTAILEVMAAKSSIRIFDDLAAGAVLGGGNLLKFKAVDLEGNVERVPIRLRFGRLGVIKPVRPRLWKRPDYCTVDSTKFKELFPNDEYGNESNPLLAPIDEVALDTVVNCDSMGEALLPVDRLGDAGEYRVELSGYGTNKDTFRMLRLLVVRNVADTALPAVASRFEPGAILLENTIKLTGPKGLDTAFVEVSLQEGRATKVLDAKLMASQLSVLDVQRYNLTQNKMPQWVMVKDNRFYTGKIGIAVPAQNKKPNRYWASAGLADTVFCGDSLGIATGGSREKLKATPLLYTEGTKRSGHFAGERADGTRDEWKVDGGLRESLLLLGSRRQSMRFPIKEYEKILYVDTFVFRPAAYIRKDLHSRNVNFRGRATHNVKDMGGLHTDRYELNDDEVEAHFFEPAPGQETAEGLASRYAGSYAISNIVAGGSLATKLNIDSGGIQHLLFCAPTMKGRLGTKLYAWGANGILDSLEQQITTLRHLELGANPPAFLSQGDTLKLAITAICNGLCPNELKINYTVTNEDLLGRKETLTDSQSVAAPAPFGEGRKFVANLAPVRVGAADCRVQISIAASCGAYTDSLSLIIPIVRRDDTDVVAITGQRAPGNEVKLPMRLGDKNLCKIEFASNPILLLASNYVAGGTLSQVVSTDLIDEYAANAFLMKMAEGQDGANPFFPNVAREQDTADDVQPKINTFRLHAHLGRYSELARYVQQDRLNVVQKKLVASIQEIRFAEGAFPWLDGMQPDREVTQNALIALGRLQNAVPNALDPLDSVVAAAFEYLDNDILFNYDIAVNAKADFSKCQISEEEIAYLYAGTYFPLRLLPPKLRQVYPILMAQAEKHYRNFSAANRIRIAELAASGGDSAVAKKLLEWVCNEYFLIKEGTGVRAAPPLRAATIATKVELLECLVKMTNDSERVHFLAADILRALCSRPKPKPREFAMAVYTAYLCPDAAATVATLPEFEYGQQHFAVPRTGKHHRSLGMYSLDCTADSFANGADSILAYLGSSGPSAIYAYYRGDHKVTASPAGLPGDSHFVLSKKLLRAAGKNKTDGPNRELADNATIALGTPMTVRLELTIDRDTDYLELSDPLAPFMVPLQVFEGMKTVQGVDYYQVEDHRGASFYINHAVKGKYVFEYTVVAGHCGRYSVGECQLYCNGTLEEKGIPDAKNIRVDERKP